MIRLCSTIATRAIALAVAIVLSASLPSIAGTTGGVTGDITDAATGHPIAGAKITIASPSQTASTVTDQNGHFTFIALEPDTYIVSIESPGYDSASITAVTIFADQQQRVNSTLSKTLKTVASVKTRANALVRAGTTSDVYSVSPAVQTAVSGSNGGGSLNQAYSALAITPGVSVPAGQSGWTQQAGVTIRGGTHSEIGYEFDGVPENVGVNNFPGNNLSTLGQQELQVYTGSAPSTSGSQGLSGFINQVVKTGTYPGYATADFGFGDPSFYHKFNVEVAGATPDRTFTYYAGYLGANQALRVLDQNDGAGYTGTYGFAYGAKPCPGNASDLDYASCYSAVTPGGLATGTGNFINFPVSWLSPQYEQDQEAIFNLHYYLPKSKAGQRDDLQLLYQTGDLSSYSFSSANDLGIAPYAYPTGNRYTGPVGQFLPTNYTQYLQPYVFPYRDAVPNIPANQEDQQQNPTSTFKAQFTHYFGSDAYLRLYGYSLYSGFLYNAPNGASNPAAGTYGNPPAYNLWQNTSGYSALFADQLGDKNYLQVQGNYIHEPSHKNFDLTFATGASTPFAVAVDGSNPNSGICYAVNGGVGTPASCENGGGATNVTYKNTASNPPTSLAGATCGTGACQYLVTENGLSGLNAVSTENQYAFSLSDKFKPTPQLTIDAGARFDSFQVIGANTQGGTTPFWFNAYNQASCVRTTPGSTPVSKLSLGLAVTDACSTATLNGASYTSVNLVDSPTNFYYQTYEPRLGTTYALDSTDVLRASYGQYAQPPASAYQFYNTLQQNLAAYIAPKFYGLGLNAPGHNLPQQVSTNIDFSFEHQFKGTDTSFKISPFYRTTRNEIAEFYIDPEAQITSGLPVGALKTSGVELALQSGNFNRDGFSGLISYTYTDAKIRYYTLPSGGSILSPINNDIKTYNAYTSYCANHATDSRCGTTNAANGKSAACFTPAGTPDAGCASGDFANPYWNAPVQNTLSESAEYVPTDLVVATTGLGVNSYTVPHVLSLVGNFKHGPFTITPTLQFQAGQKYGAPETTAGLDPAGGCGTLAGSTTGDPRYPYGAAGGSPYDALTCPSALNAIPDPYTGKFDAIGAFTSPTQMLGSLTSTYTFGKRVTARLTVANLIDQCFGGSKEPWTGYGTPHVCSYESGEISRGYAPTGNIYNPGAKISPYAALPYYPYLGPYTMGVVNPSGAFNAYLDVSVKL
jgi:hypothetical protein